MLCESRKLGIVEVWSLRLMGCQLWGVNRDLTCGDPAGSAQIANSRSGSTRITACEFGSEVGWVRRLGERVLMGWCLCAVLG